MYLRVNWCRAAVLHKLGLDRKLKLSPHRGLRIMMSLFWARLSARQDSLRNVKTNSGEQQSTMWVYSKYLDCLHLAQYTNLLPFWWLAAVATRTQAQFSTKYLLMSMQYCGKGFWSSGVHVNRHVLVQKYFICSQRHQLRNHRTQYSCWLRLHNSVAVTVWK